MQIEQLEAKARLKNEIQERVVKTRNEAGKRNQPIEGNEIGERRTGETVE